MLGAALALLLAGAPVPASVVGYYEAHQMELGAGLELKSDGRFLYALDYGAVSEGAEGHWSIAGEHVLLSTDNPLDDPERSMAKLNHEPLQIEGDALVLSRYDRSIRFERHDR